VADFEDGKLDGWALRPESKARIKKHEGNAFLEIPGRGRAPTLLPVGQHQDFSLSLSVMKGNGGVQFRNGYKAFFKSNGDVWIRRPGAMLVRWVRKPCDIQKRFQRMKVVCNGPIVRFYMNGHMELEMLDHTPKKTRVCLLGSCFDNIEFSADTPVDEKLMALPQDAGALGLYLGSGIRASPR
jgi:hypothetical protein